MTVTGLSTDDADRVRAALVSTARTMTTLHVERDRLERVVAGYPVVRALEIETDFPHAMSIRVVEHRPVAIVVTGGARLPVAADGTVLDGLPVEGRLPLVRADGGLREQPAGRSRAPSARPASPEPPLGRCAVALREIGHESDRGYVVQLREGPRAGVRQRRRICAPSGWPRRACSPTATPRERPTWTCACPAARRWAASGSRSPRPALPTAPLPLGTEEGAVAGAVAEDPGAADPTETPAGVTPVDPALEQAPVEGHGHAGGAHAGGP